MDSSLEAFLFLGECLLDRDVELMISGGPGPRGAMATMSQYMLSSAATFGFFMSIGSVSLPASHTNPMEWIGEKGAKGNWREQN